MLHATNVASAWRGEINKDKREGRGPVLQGWWHNASHERGQVSAGLVVVRYYRDGRLEQALYTEKGLEASISDVPSPNRA